MNSNYEIRRENLKLQRQQHEQVARLRDVLSKKWSEIEDALTNLEQHHHIEDSNNGGNRSQLSDIQVQESTVPGERLLNMDTITRRKRIRSDDENDNNGAEVGDGAVANSGPSISQVFNDDCIPEDVEGEDFVASRSNKSEKMQDIFRDSVESIEQNNMYVPSVKIFSPGKRQPLVVQSPSKNNIDSSKTGEPKVITGRKRMKTSPKENEKMPDTSFSSADSPRTGRRRSRGAPVNYALPSLRTKMRREQVEFVDAVSDTKLEGSENSEEETTIKEEEESPAPTNVNSRRRRTSTMHASMELSRRASTGTTLKSKPTIKRTRKSIAI